MCNHIECQHDTILSWTPAADYWCVKVRLTILSGFHMHFDHSDVMGKPRSCMVTEWSNDTGYINANKVGSHDPLGMTETADSIITINDYILAYTVSRKNIR